jgi:archaellin
MKRTLLYSLLTLLLSISGYTQTLAQQTKAVHNPRVNNFVKKVGAQGATSARVHIDQAAGTLNLSSGAQSLMDATFAFTRDEWQPEISYSTSNAQGRLVVKQPKPGNNINMQDNDRNEWQVRLTNAIPLDVQLSVGAGESNIDLSNTRLTNLELQAGAGDFTLNLANTSVPRVKVNAGVGQMKLDLSGKWQNDLDAQINGGIGEVRVKLPRRTGVRVKVNGLGSINAEGFRKENGYYVNEAYATSDTRLTLEINGGLGEVTLELAN